MWVKICGVTRVEDAIAIAESGACAIGLNFFSRSRRYVLPECAAAICEALRSRSPDVDMVGVFVNSPPEDVIRAASSLQLSAIQFHGDESPDLIAAIHHELPEIAVIRALRIDAENADSVFHHVDQLSSQIPVSACLLDALVPGEYGGTGIRVDLRLLQRYAEVPRPPLIVAGGLTPDNVGEVVREIRPWGVDTASGVEDSPGIKNISLCRRFVSEATGSGGPTNRRLS